MEQNNRRDEYGDSAFSQRGFRRQFDERREAPEEFFGSQKFRNQSFHDEGNRFFDSRDNRMNRPAEYQRSVSERASPGFSGFQRSSKSSGNKFGSFGTTLITDEENKATRIYPSGNADQRGGFCNKESENGYDGVRRFGTTSNIKVPLEEGTERSRFGGREAPEYSEDSRLRGFDRSDRFASEANGSRFYRNSSSDVRGQNVVSVPHHDVDDRSQSRFVRKFGSSINSRRNAEGYGGKVGGVGRGISTYSSDDARSNFDSGWFSQSSNPRFPSRNSEGSTSRFGFNTFDEMDRNESTSAQISRERGFGAPEREGGFGRSGFRGREDSKGDFGQRFHDSDTRFNHKAREMDRFGGSDLAGGDDSASRPKPVTYVPEDRGLDELYKDDAENFARMVQVDDLDLPVTVEGHGVSVKSSPLETWENGGFEQLLLRNLEKCKYVQPRRIQSAVIPLIMNGFDVLGHAETGGGKTAAFLIPIIDHIMKSSRCSDNYHCAPIALTIAPTRELVLQLYDHARKLAAGTGVTVAKAYGQYSPSANFSEIQRGCDLLFATPGRLMDFIEKGRIKLHRILFLIIDEADQMLGGTCGFKDQMLTLSTKSDFPMASKRQTLMFSATFDDEVRSFALQLLKDEYVFVSNGRVSAANLHVEQRFKLVSGNSGTKLETLFEILKEDEKKEGEVRRTLVFVTKKNVTDVVSLYLSNHGIPATSIHGGREQAERETALNGFRRGEIKVLVATDVCARGIDITNLDHVVNYDLPLTSLTYIHRIGRTGRLRRGTATSFIDPSDPNDSKLVPEIIKIVRDVEQEVPKFMLDISSGFGSYLSANQDELNTGFGTSAFSSSGFGQSKFASNAGSMDDQEKDSSKPNDDDNEGWE